MESEFNSLLLLRQPGKCSNDKGLVFARKKTKLSSALLTPDDALLQDKSAEKDSSQAGDATSEPNIFNKSFRKSDQAPK